MNIKTRLHLIPCLLAVALFAGVSVPVDRGASNQASPADPLHEKAAHVKPVSGVGDDLGTAFNKNHERVQLLMILSPT